MTPCRSPGRGERERGCIFFRPSRGLMSSRFSPGLTPRAVFCRRYRGSARKVSQQERIMSDAQAPLKNFPNKHDFLVAIDSDGCAFDTMEIKHKECFIPNIIKHWDLQPVSKFARAAAEFVNL